MKPQIGRTGPEQSLALHNRKTKMNDRRLRRLQTRSKQNEAAIKEQI